MHLLLLLLLPLLAEVGRVEAGDCASPCQGTCCNGNSTLPPTCCTDSQQCMYYQNKCYDTCRFIGNANCPTGQECLTVGTNPPTPTCMDVGQAAYNSSGPSLYSVATGPCRIMDVRASCSAYSGGHSVWCSVGILGQQSIILANGEFVYSESSILEYYHESQSTGGGPWHASAERYYRVSFSTPPLSGYAGDAVLLQVGGEFGSGSMGAWCIGDLFTTNVPEFNLFSGDSPVKVPINHVPTNVSLRFGLDSGIPDVPVGGFFTFQPSYYVGEGNQPTYFFPHPTLEDKSANGYVPVNVNSSTYEQAFTFFFNVGPAVEHMALEIYTPPWSSSVNGSALVNMTLLPQHPIIGSRGKTMYLNLTDSPTNAGCFSMHDNTMSLFIIEVVGFFDCEYVLWHDTPGKKPVRLDNDNPIASAPVQLSSRGWVMYYPILSDQVGVCSPELTFKFK